MARNLFQADQVPALGGVSRDFVFRKNYLYNITNGLYLSGGFSGSDVAGRLVIVDNLFEMAAAAGLKAIRLDGAGSTSPYRFKTVIIRGNRIRPKDGLDSNYQIWGVDANSVEQATIENNIVQTTNSDRAVALSSSVAKAQVFNNRAPDGTFFPAYNASTGLHVPELTTEAENYALSL